MTYFDELDLLDDAETEAQQIAEQMDFDSDVDRRKFVFMSLAAAAATTFGFGSKALAQGARGAGADSTAPAGRGGGRGQGGGAPQAPLDGMENISWTFMAYPGGTGALIDKTMREKGAAAFTRQKFASVATAGAFYIAPWGAAPFPTNDEDIAFLPAHRLSAAIKGGKITSTRLTKIYLERLKKYNPTLLFAVTITEELALKQAAQADAEIKAGRYRGPLHGLPWGIKDLFAVKGTPTTWGAKDFANRIIDVDSEVYTRLTDAGAVLVAKLSTGQFAQGAGWWDGERSTRSPWGGSASGSSAGPGSATAAGAVAFSIGTETAGSIIGPTTTNGLCCLRPTFGRVSRHGGMVLGWSQDRVGPMTRTAMDAAMVFNVIHGSDEKDPGTITMPFRFNHNINFANLRVGLRAPGGGGGRGGAAPAGGAAPQYSADMTAFIQKCRDLGMKTHELGAPPGAGGGAFGPESAAAFDFYVQAKARQYNIPLADLVAMYTTGGGGGGGGGRGGRGGADSTAGRGAAAADSTAGRGGGRGGAGRPGERDGQLNRWIPGRVTTAMDFLNGERRRLIAITQWQAYLKDTDLYIGASDSGSRTGHPDAVVQIGFGGGGGGGGGRAGGADSTAAADTAGRGGGAGRGGAGGGRGGAGGGQPRPATTQIIGNLFNDDLILSFAHKYQINTKWHLNRPKIEG